MVHCNNSSTRKIRAETLPREKRIASKKLVRDLWQGSVSRVDGRFTARAVHFYLLTRFHPFVS